MASGGCVKILNRILDNGADNTIHSKVGSWGIALEFTARMYIINMYVIAVILYKDINNSINKYIYNVISELIFISYV